MKILATDLKLDWGKADQFAQFIERGLNGGQIRSPERVASVTDTLCKAGRVSIVEDNGILWLRLDGMLNLEPGIAWLEGETWTCDDERIRPIVAELTGLEVQLGIVAR